MQERPNKTPEPTNLPIRSATPTPATKKIEINYQNKSKNTSPITKSLPKFPSINSLYSSIYSLSEKHTNIKNFLLLRTKPASIIPYIGPSSQVINEFKICDFRQQFDELEEEYSVLIDC